IVYIFRKFNYSIFFEILFCGWCPMLQLSTKKISLKSDTEHRKYARFSRLVLFFACLLPQLSGLLSRMLTGSSYSASTTDECRSKDAMHLMVCLASIGKEFDAENSLRVEQ